MSELRKVQQTPTGTYFVCLPRAWSKKNGLKKGSLISINEADEGKLIIDPSYNQEPALKTSNLTIGPYLSREIVGHYLLGSDIIQIKANNRIDSDFRSIVKTTATSLIGLEIVEENCSTIVLQCLLEPSGFPPEKILKRNYTIIAGMVRDSVNSFINCDYQLAKSVISRDNENNRLYFLLVRILRTILQSPQLGQKLGLTTLDCLDYRLAASLIETMGDACANIAKKTLELNNTPLAAEIRKLVSELQSLCSVANEQALTSFELKDVTLAEKVRLLKEKVENISSSIYNLVGTNYQVMPQILATTSFLREIYAHSIDLADLVV